MKQKRKRLWSVKHIISFYTPSFKNTWSLISSLTHLQNYFTSHTQWMVWRKYSSFEFDRIVVLNIFRSIYRWNKKKTTLKRKTHQFILHTQLQKYFKSYFISDTSSKLFHVSDSMNGLTKIFIFRAWSSCRS